MLDATEHPLSLDAFTPMIFSFAKLRLVDLHFLAGAADFFFTEMKNSCYCNLSAFFVPVVDRFAFSYIHMISDELQVAPVPPEVSEFNLPKS